MTCTWCKAQATQGALLPEGVKGKDYWTACDRHAYLIDAIKLDRVDISEIEMIERREQKAQQKAALQGG